MKRGERAWAVVLAWSVRLLLLAILLESLVRTFRSSVPSPTGALFGIPLVLILLTYSGLHYLRISPKWDRVSQPMPPAPEPVATDAASDLAAIVESSGDAIVSLSLESKVLTWNPAAARIFGYSSSEMVGKSVFLLVPFGKGVELQSSLKKVLRGESAEPYETILLRKDTTAVEVSVSLSPIRDSEGKLLRISCICRELSAQRRSERLIHQLSRVVEQTADMVLITDAQGVVEYVNPAFEKMTGYSREEAIGGRPNLLKSGAHDAAFYAELWRRILAGESYQGEITNKRKDGTLFRTEKTISPIRDSTGKITHFVSTDKDITARHWLPGAPLAEEPRAAAARIDTSASGRGSRKSGRTPSSPWRG